MNNVEGRSETPLPRWLEMLLKTKFFEGCRKHAEVKKNERNIFCVDCCCQGFCQHCQPAHQGHKLLQIRRYVYNDVVRLQDIDKMVPCGGVQTYIINNARVVFLNERPQPRPSKGSSNGCETCDRSLQDNFRFCSVGCKVKSLSRSGYDFCSSPPSSEPVIPGTPDIKNFRTKRGRSESSEDADENQSVQSKESPRADNILEVCTLLAKKPKLEGLLIPEQSKVGGRRKKQTPLRSPSS